MTSLRHNSGPEREPRDAYLDAARECILDVGWRRTTLTEVARRAGVSRMTIYRTWSDMQQLLGDLMTREWGAVVTEAVAAEDAEADPVGQLVDEVVGTVRALRDNELFVRIVELDPELLLPYLLSRRGRSQDAILALTEQQIRAGQETGAVRAGNPIAIARSMLLTAHGFVLSAHTMVDDARDRGRARRRAPAGPGPGPRAVTGQRITPGLAGLPDEVDLVVIGLGVTGAGVALDAVTRGLSVLAVDAHDLAFGTSRWSSKLVHGGLRYLANGQVGVAHESAVERGILMEVTAPHLTHALPFLIPLTSSVSGLQGGVARGGIMAGDLLRRGARTSRDHPAHPAPDLGHRGHLAGARPAALRPARRAPLLGRPARGRRPPGDHHRPDGRRRRRPRPHPRPGALRDRHVASSSATS